MPRLRENYDSLETLLSRNGSKLVFWDINTNNHQVYRFSSFFMKFLREYIKKLLNEHRRGKVHVWDNLLKNVLFRKGETMKISFLKKPRKLTLGDLKERKKQDFVGLAKLLEEIRSYHELPRFQNEISKFISLLKNPIGNVYAIQSHFALHDFRKRIDTIYSIQRLRENVRNIAFHARTSFFDSEGLLKALTKKDHFSDVFITDGDFKQILDRNYVEGEDNLGDVHSIYANNFGELVRFIRNFIEHRHKACNEIDKDLEWKVYCYFPFYYRLLCEKLDEVGFSRLT